MVWLRACLPSLIVFLSDLHERVALPSMNDDRRAKVHVRAASRRRVLETNFPQVLAQLTCIAEKRSNQQMRKLLTSAESGA